MIEKTQYTVYVRNLQEKFQIYISKCISSCSHLNHQSIAQKQTQVSLDIWYSSCLLPISELTNTRIRPDISLAVRCDIMLTETGCTTSQTL